MISDTTSRTLLIGPMKRLDPKVAGNIVKADGVVTASKHELIKSKMYCIVVMEIFKILKT